MVVGRVPGKFLKPWPFSVKPYIGKPIKVDGERETGLAKSHDFQTQMEGLGLGRSSGSVSPLKGCMLSSLTFQFPRILLKGSGKKLIYLPIWWMKGRHKRLEQEMADIRSMRATTVAVALNILVRIFLQLLTLRRPSICVQWTNTDSVIELCVAMQRGTVLARKLADNLKKSNFPYQIVTGRHPVLSRG